MWRPISPRCYTASAVALLLSLFVFTVYKAWTQSITLDEAFTYKIWVAAPFSSFFTVKGYNNHPLNTLLCRLSVGALGVSEITLRLPSLLLGGVYLAAIYRIARRWFGPTGWMLLAVALNAANPLVLDHFATARGYGMGLAFWALGTCLLLPCLEKKAGARRWMAAGAAFGLAVAAYMTEIFAVAALAAVLAALYGRRALWLTAAAVAVAGPILYGPLRLATPGGIDGERTWKLAIQTFLWALVQYKLAVVASWKFGWHMLSRWPYGVWLGFMGLLLLATVVLVVRRAREPVDRHLLVFAPAVLGTFALLRVEPVVAGHVFFAERRLLFTAPLLLLAAPLLFYWLGRQGRWGAVAGRAGAGALALLALHLASMFTLEWFWGWDYDAGTKAIAGVLRQRKPDSVRPPARVGASWILQSSLNFYRDLYAMDWIAPVTPADAGCYCDYYVVEEKELAGLARFSPRVLYRSPAARTVLAEPGPVIAERLAALARAGFTGPVACQADLTRREAFTAAGRPGVNGHILRDVMETAETDLQRWTFERPAWLFDAIERGNKRFRLDFRLHGATYRETGPVRLTVRINGRELAAQLYSSAEGHRFERPVPAGWIGDDGLAVVETTLDKYFIAPQDKQKLGYLFVSGGFVN
jgi:hypothetical protein